MSLTMRRRHIEYFRRHYSLYCEAQEELFPGTSIAMRITYDPMKDERMRVNRILSLYNPLDRYIYSTPAKMFR